MKGKFSLMWRVVIALVLVLSFSLVAAVPAGAADQTTVVFETWDGGGDGSWSDTPTGYSGSYCVKLTGPMIVRVPYGETFEDLAVVAGDKIAGQDVWDIMWRIYDTGGLYLHAKIYLDTTLDGEVDTVLTGGYGATAPSRAVDGWYDAWMGFGSAWQIDAYDDGVWTDAATVGLVTYDAGVDDLQLNVLLTDDPAWPAATVVYLAYGYVTGSEAYVDDITVAGVDYEVDPARVVDSEDNVLDTVPDGTSFYLHVTSAGSNVHPADPDTLDVTLDIYDGVALDTSGDPISTATYTATETGKTTDEFWTDAIDTTDLGVRPGYKLVPSWSGGSLPGFVRAEVSFDKSYYDVNETMTITVKDDTANKSSTADPETLLGADCEIFWVVDSTLNALTSVAVTDFVETGKDTGIFQCEVVPSAEITADFDPGDTMEIHYGNKTYDTTVTPDLINTSGSDACYEVKATAHVLMYTTSSVAFDNATYAVTETSATITVTDPDKNTSASADTISGTDVLVVENLATGDSVSFNSLTETDTDSNDFEGTVTFGTGTDELPINDGDQLKATYTDPATPEDVSTATANIGTPVSLYDAAGDLVKSYTTIAAALADASTDYTIEVGPGTYTPSSKLTIDVAGLTLKGANYGVNPVTETRGAESIIDASNVPFTAHGAIDINKSDVTVDGFTLEDSVGFGMTMAPDTSGVTIQNNVITNSAKIAINISGTGNVVANNIIEDSYSVYLNSGTSDHTIENNTITGCTATIEGAISFVGSNDGNTISGNTITGGLGSGIYFWDGGVCDNNLIEGNTISANADCGIEIATTTAPTDLTIVGNDITDNEGVGILVESWTAASDAIKFNDITGNDTTDGYGLQNSSSGTVDATHNWWGATSSTDIAAMINDVTSSDVTTYDPWLDASVSVAAFDYNATFLDAKITVGVEVSGVANTGTAKIGAALYTANPKATPTFTPLENGFFDVYVVPDTITPATDEVILKFYAANENSVVYAWNELGMWEECTLQDFVSYGGGYIWVKVHSELNTTEPTIPTIEGLQYLPFAISVEEVRTLQSIAVTPATASIGVGGTKQFTATGTYNLAPLTEDITTLVTWASSDVSKATIDATGLATGVAEGTTNITATLDTIVSAPAVLTVEEFNPMVYDADEDGVISKVEALTAVADYFVDAITKAQALEVIALYFAS